MRDDRTIAETFPPGDFIEEELEARGWVQEDLARIVDKPLPTVNKIIKGKTAITPDTAKKLGAAFGNSAKFWMNLEAAWQLSQSDESASGVRERAAIYEMAPVREMVRRGWIRRTRTPEELADQLLKHFAVQSLDEVPQLRAAAKAAVRGEDNPMTPEQWAWMCRCRHVSYLVDAEPYRQKALQDCVPALVRLANEPEQVRLVPGLLAEAGVRLVIVQHLQHTRLDGGALFRHENEPVVALSLRYNRLDNFWQTLLHEIAHIINGDGERADADVCQSGGDNVDEAELRANEMACRWLVPKEDFESFIRRTTPLYSTRRIVSFSRRMGVHPSIVVGQLKFRGEVEWEMFNRLNANVRDMVRQSSMSDGWAEPAPVE